MGGAQEGKSPGKGEIGHVRREGSSGPRKGGKKGRSPARGGVPGHGRSAPAPRHVGQRGVCRLRRGKWRRAPRGHGGQGTPAPVHPSEGLARCSAWEEVEGSVCVEEGLSDLRLLQLLPLLEKRLQEPGAGAPMRVRVRDRERQSRK